MTEKLPDVWSTRDFPVLVEVARRIDAGDRTPRVEEVGAALDMPVEQVQLAGAALKRRGLVDAFGAMQAEVLRFRGLSGEAYFRTVRHPSGDDAVSALVDALRQAADQTTDPDEKSRLSPLADNALGVGRTVLGGVLVSVLTMGALHTQGAGDDTAPSPVRDDDAGHAGSLLSDSNRRPPVYKTGALAS